MNQIPNQPQKSNQKTPKVYAHLLDSTPSIWQSRLEIISKHRKTAVTAAVGLFLGFGLAVSKMGFANEEKLNLDSVYSDVTINNEVQARMNSCQQGGAGTVGESMMNALKIHQDFASITPPVEKLFNESGCFDKLNKLVDLSIAIPSISSIASSIGKALFDVAQKKICKAVNKASDMLADPINAGLQKINRYTDLNSLANRTISQKLSQVDPELGASFVYTPPGFQQGMGINEIRAGDTLEKGLQGAAASLMGNHQGNIQGMQNSMQTANNFKSPEADMEKARQDALAYNRNVDQANYQQDTSSPYYGKQKYTEGQIQQMQSNLAVNQLNSAAGLVTLQSNGIQAQPQQSTIGALTANSTQKNQGNNKGLSGILGF